MNKIRIFLFFSVLAINMAATIAIYGYQLHNVYLFASRVDNYFYIGLYGLLCLLFGKSLVFIIDVITGFFIEKINA